MFSPPKSPPNFFLAILVLRIWSTIKFGGFAPLKSVSQLVCYCCCCCLCLLTAISSLAAFFIHLAANKFACQFAAQPSAVQIGWGQTKSAKRGWTVDTIGPWLEFLVGHGHTSSTKGQQLPDRAGLILIFQQCGCEAMNCNCNGTFLFFSIRL